MALTKSSACLEEAELQALIMRLVDAPEHADNPMREPLLRLVKHCEGQRERLERLVRISDGYHSISRDQRLSLAEQYDKQLRRLEKLARISDRYQNSLRELSEALKDSASHDPLTGLDNRRALTERLREESERATRKHQAYALSILDVDRFKLINDRFGHDIGDKALCAISDAIRGSLREYDACGRWGGEEFLILLPETASEYASQVIERVRAAIAQIRIDVQESALPPITASFGLTLYRPGESFSDTISRADTLLRVAKAQGRNRVIVD
ncbi:biofilm regulation diguanylate cyclase SiaD [Propionivibrio dicarboxylicus]|uniref:diguanylate cyclase n=1 Tax=Propionivibrio dicarboxylicus TaxID=83767 RepID=A0A1G8GQT4_9RHOO|nr:biofilm regulation diguanylate cyclase SiaD [Propionivibrio dicarboxylicus]SDH96778.1 diguanylate cyclase (GGDEF) domain-containing protein [Propionivibrio dicarboxylicus]